jgi:hypothetical protein
MRRSPTVTTLVVAVVVLLAGGCASSDSTRTGPAAAAADAFGATAASDPAAACRLLAPKTRAELESTSGPCPDALAAEPPPVGGRVLDVEVFGLDAMVRLEHDTVFLARFDRGWRVTAAGCVPGPKDRPFTCDVTGG